MKELGELFAVMQQDVANSHELHNDYLEELKSIVLKTHADKDFIGFMKSSLEDAGYTIIL